MKRRQPIKALKELFFKLIRRHESFQNSFMIFNISKKF